MHSYFEITMRVRKNLHEFLHSSWNGRWHTTNFMTNSKMALRRNTFSLMSNVTAFVLENNKIEEEIKSKEHTSFQIVHQYIKIIPSLDSKTWVCFPLPPGSMIQRALIPLHELSHPVRKRVIWLSL